MKKILISTIIPLILVGCNSTELVKEKPQNNEELFALMNEEMNNATKEFNKDMSGHNLTVIECDRFKQCSRSSVVISKERPITMSSLTKQEYIHEMPNKKIEYAEYITNEYTEGVSILAFYVNEEEKKEYKNKYLNSTVSYDEEGFKVIVKDSKFLKFENINQLEKLVRVPKMQTQTFNFNLSDVEDVKFGMNQEKGIMVKWH